MQPNDFFRKWQAQPVAAQTTVSGFSGLIEPLKNVNMIFLRIADAGIGDLAGYIGSIM